MENYELIPFYIFQEVVQHVPIIMSGDCDYRMVDPPWTVSAMVVDMIENNLIPFLLLLCPHNGGAINESAPNSRLLQRGDSVSQVPESFLIAGILCN